MHITTSAAPGADTIVTVALNATAIATTTTTVSVTAANTAIPSVKEGSQPMHIESRTLTMTLDLLMSSLSDSSFFLSLFWSAVTQ